MVIPRLVPAFLLLLLAAGRCTAAALLRGSGRAEGRLETRQVLELLGLSSRERTDAAAAALAGHGARTPERKNRSSPGLETPLRDPRHKEKFIKHLTGPLYINPKCRKHFRRLYHNTRDCTTPSYYKRCARLLMRLASSPRCMER